MNIVGQPFSLNHEDCLRSTRAVWPLMETLFPICRSITGEGVRQSLQAVSQFIPLQIFEVPSGTPIFDWTVPDEWNVTDAFIADATGRRVVDFKAHSLHVVSYSTPVDELMPLERLRAHLHSLPDRPDTIPYRTSYYDANWGFCLKHSVLKNLSEGEYHARIDATLKPGHLTYGECLIEGESADEVLVFTHVCHPSMVNDNLTGIAIATALAQEVARTRPRLTYRFVFAPGTIGSIAWLARNESRVGSIRHGLVLGLLGDRGPLTYKRSRAGDTVIDQSAAHVLGRGFSGARLMDFEPYGYDERQFCSPGFNLAVGRLTRSPNGQYPEYHSSDDDFSVVGEEELAQSLRAALAILRTAECNQTLLNLQPKCEPRLGVRGLYRPVGGGSLRQSESAMLWVLNQSDGTHSLLDIADRSGLEFPVIVAAAQSLIEAKLVGPAPPTLHGRRGVQ